MKKNKLTDIFNNKASDRKAFRKAFNKLFIRQLDDVSCAAAAIATAARLYDLEEDRNYKLFRKELKVNLKGSSHSDIVKVSKRHLPVIEQGRNVYHNGIAIAYIRYKPSGENHAVVFLAKKGSTIVYYDPADHRIYHDKVHNMRRSTRGKYDGKEKTWTANLPPIKGATFDFWMKHAEKNPYVLKKQVFWIREQRARKAAAQKKLQQ